MSAPAARLRPVHPGRRRWIEALRSTISLALLLTGAAVCLRLIDELPGAAIGVARGVRHLPSVEALAADSGLRMPLPTFFPDTIQWPPSDVLTYASTSASAWFRGRTDRTTWLIIAIARGPAAIAPQVAPPVSVRQSEPTLIGGHPAVAERVQDADGVVWHQVAWTTPDGPRLVRYRGTLDTLMTIAGSMSERGRR